MIDRYSDPAAALLAAGDRATPSDPAVVHLGDLLFTIATLTNH